VLAHNIILVIATKKSSFNIINHTLQPIKPVGQLNIICFEVASGVLACIGDASDGINFYVRLSDYLKSIKQQISDFVFARSQEKAALLATLGESIASSRPPISEGTAPLGSANFASPGRAFGQQQPSPQNAAQMAAHTGLQNSAALSQSLPKAVPQQGHPVPQGVPQGQSQQLPTAPPVVGFSQPQPGMQNAAYGTYAQPAQQATIAGMAPQPGMAQAGAPIMVGQQGMVGQAGAVPGAAPQMPGAAPAGLAPQTQQQFQGLTPEAQQLLMGLQQQNAMLQQQLSQQPRY
jgi:hypothetical protein